MAVENIEFPGTIDRLFYFPGYDSSKPVFRDKISALAFGDNDEKLRGAEPREGCILSYNMIGVPYLDKNDYKGSVPEGFTVVDSVGYFNRTQPSTPPEFFASAVDVARFATGSPIGNDVAINANFRIVPVLILDDIRNE